MVPLPAEKVLNIQYDTQLDTLNTTFLILPYANTTQEACWSMSQEPQALPMLSSACSFCLSFLFFRLKCFSNVRACLKYRFCGVVPWLISLAE